MRTIELQFVSLLSQLPTSGSASSVSGPCSVEWTEATHDGPPVLVAYGMAYDEVRDEIVLFGGNNGLVATSDETWTYDPASSSWQEPPVAAPPPGRSNPGVVFHEGLGKVVMFGGVGNPQPGQIVSFNDLWSWEGDRWQAVAVVGPDLPPPRSPAGMVYDPQRNRLVMLGGADLSQNPVRLYNDLWEWRSGSWRRLRPDGNTVGPSPRGASGMAYAGGGRVLLFGGSEPLPAAPFILYYGDC